MDGVGEVVAVFVAVLPVLGGFLIIHAITHRIEQTKAAEHRRRMAEREDARRRIGRAAGRFDLMVGDRIALLDCMADATPAERAERTIPLRPDVEAWMRTHVRGWCRVRESVLPDHQGVVVIDHPDDAFAFKMRWL